MSCDLDCIVVGAGVVGLAVARALADTGREVVLIDRAEGVGTETSSRNSEVVHAGIYYPVGSLKAVHCVRGNRMLYEYCQARGVAHRRTGKLIVACDEREVSTLDFYLESARNNGVAAIGRIDSEELEDLEPNVEAVAALYSPSTGIVDSHELMNSLLADFEALGGTFVSRTEFVSARSIDGGFACTTRDEKESVISTRTLVNSAGLMATSVARSIADMPRELIPETEFAIGHYYVLDGAAPFSHLVYPVAEAGGLGVHATIDLSGATRFGPDVRWIESVDYTFQDDRRSEFAASIRRYCPGILEEDLTPGYTGIRPKIGGRASPSVDFVVQTQRDHAVPGLINLFGIESPGLTAALSLGELVAESEQTFA